MPSEESKIAVLEEQMKVLTKGQEGLGVKMDKLSDKIDLSYYTKQDHENFYHNEFVPLQDSVEKLLWWIIGTLLAAIGGLILAVINYFSAHHPL